MSQIADLDLGTAPPPGVELVVVTTGEDVEALVRVHDEVLGGDHEALGQEVAAAVGAAEPGVVAVLARAGGTAVTAGRVELRTGTDVAGTWGGGTLPGWRRRGVFRALVAQRAALASARGLRSCRSTPCLSADRSSRGWASSSSRRPRRTAGEACAPARLDAVAAHGMRKGRPSSTSVAWQARRDRSGPPEEVQLWQVR